MPASRYVNKLIPGDTTVSTYVNYQTGPDHVPGRRSLLDPPCPSAAMDAGGAGVDLSGLLIPPQRFMGSHGFSFWPSFDSDVT